MNESEKHDLTMTGRSWLAFAPAAGPGAPGLLGWTGNLDFVCVHCAGRILGRGCALRKLADQPVWLDTPGTPGARVCALCETA